ncbi:MAG TPA: bifunctional nuclease family protein [Fimbriimonadales bacterium]|nr:bifunctional nuclease family protein [Fimbriimonadales bacterium]
MPEEEFEKDDFEYLEEPPPFFPKELNRGGGSGTPIRVHVEGVYGTEEAGMMHRFVQLMDSSNRILPISIGPFEAMAIQLALEGRTVARPLTHDLMKHILDRLDGGLERVVIDDLWNSTYYAKLYIQKNGEEIEIDCRPSDAIALALRTGTPIYVLDSILESFNQEEE